MGSSNPAVGLDLNGLSTAEAKDATIEWLERRSLGQRQVRGAAGLYGFVGRRARPREGLAPVRLGAAGDLGRVRWVSAAAGTGDGPPLPPACCLGGARARAFS